VEKEAVTYKGKIPGFVKAMSSDHREQVRILHGLREHAGSDGPGSFLLSLPAAAINSAIKGKGQLRENRMRNFAYRNFHAPLASLDSTLGSLPSKIPLIGGAFRTKEKAAIGKNLEKTVERSSILGPVIHARNFAVPIVAGIGIDKGIKEFREKLKQRQEQSSSTGETMDKTSQELQKKVASTMLRLNATNKEHEKRAQATRLLFKQAELGIAPLPDSYQEYEQKLASLVSQDLAVLEKAMELNTGLMSMGELTGSNLNPNSAVSTFQAEVLG
jgi:hypothetical protein